MKMHLKRVQELAGWCAATLVGMVIIGALFGAVDIRDAKGLLGWALIFAVIVVLLEERG